MTDFDGGSLTNNSPARKAGFKVFWVAGQEPPLNPGPRLW